MDIIYDDIFEAIRAIEPDHLILEAKSDYQKHGFVRPIIRTNRYDLMDMGDGTFSAFPPQFVVRYYRGENKYFKLCTPGIYRRKNTDPKKSELDFMRDQIKIIDFYDILNQFPQVEIAKNMRARVDYLAIAQHYELKTSLIDFTSDIVTAAFFATHEFRSGDYYPITAGNGYIKVFMHFPSMNDNIDINFHMFGLQPFLRPGLQSAYALQFKDETDFSLPTNIIAFRQSPYSNVFGWLLRHPKEVNGTTNKVLTDYCYLFPEEEICIPAKLIRDRNSVTIKNFMQYCEQNEIDPYQLQKLFTDYGISVTNEPHYSVSEQRREQLFKEYEDRPFGDVQIFSRLMRSG